MPPPACTVTMPFFGSHAGWRWRIHIAGEIQIAECAAVYAALPALLFLDDFARADLACA